MPPRKRARPSTSGPPATSAPKPSKLARQHGLTPTQESEIREAFSLFCLPSSPSQDPESITLEDSSITTADVRRCLVALGIRIAPKDMAETLETLDPEDEGYVPYAHFFEFAALHMRHRAGEEDEGDEYADAGEGQQRQEVMEAYSLFTHGAPGPITLGHLKRVARELKEDVSEDLLRAMLSEANGGSWKSGVGVEEFEGVMRRAGVFG